MAINLSQALDLGWPEPPEGFESWALWFAALDDEHREGFLDRLDDEQKARLWYQWGFFARNKQRPPIEHDWRYWLVLAGRGFGKTRVGAETVIRVAQSGCLGKHSIALVAATVADARDTMVEGVSGILACSPPWFRPQWIPSKRLLIWPNGATAHTYSADIPDRLRGPQHAFAWADELAAWRNADAWDQLLMGLRLGSDPRVIITTTPRPIPIVRELLKDPGTLVTTGSTYENRANLADPFLEKIVAKYEGTRLGRQEIYAHLLDDNPAALWRRATIEQTAKRKNTEALVKHLRETAKRVVVAVDPAVTANERSDETGIVVCALGQDGHGYLLDDCSGTYKPAEWARAALWKYSEWDADAIIAEVNNGGDMVESTLRAVDARCNIKKVHASRGKATRAEPVAALYEQGKCHHVGAFPQLEDQLCDWDPVNDKDSPDRLDAVVWGFTDLMLGDRRGRPGPMSDDLAAMLG